MRWAATVLLLLLCASNALADISGFGAPPSVGGSGETNTYTSSKTFTQDVLLRGTGQLRASSATFTYGISAGTGTFSSTVAVRGDAFSVGTSTFAISAGNFAFGASAPTAGTYIVITRPSKTLTSNPGPTIDVAANTYTHSTGAGIIGSEIGGVRIQQQTLKTSGGGFSSYDNAGSLLITSPPSCISGTTCASTSSIVMGGHIDHKIEVARRSDSENHGASLTVKSGDASTLLEANTMGGSLYLKSGNGMDFDGSGSYHGGHIYLDPGSGLSNISYGNVLMVNSGGNVGIATAAPASLFTIGNGTFSVQGGSATVAYRMTAASFSGDGSNLTNLPSAEGNTYASSKTFTSDVLLRGTGKMSASSATFTYGISAASATFTSTVAMTGNLIFDSPGVYSLTANQFAFSGARLGYPTSGLYFNAVDPGYEFKDLLGVAAQHLAADGSLNYFTGPSSFGESASITGATIETLGPGTGSGSYSFAALNNDFSHFMAFDDAGHLSIDKVSPGYTLDIGGDFRASGQSIIEGTSTIKGERFSVGGSSFSVVGGSATVSYRAQAGSFLTTSSVTASAFFGNGSALTGVTATESNTMTSSKTFTSDVLAKSSVTANALFIWKSTVTTVYGIQKKTKTSDQVFYSSAALPVNLGSDITGLDFDLVGGTSYYFEYDLTHESTATTTGIWFGMTYPSASTITWIVEQPISLSSFLFRASRGSEFATLAGTDVDVANQPIPARLYGNITVGKIGGKLQPRVKCELQTGRGQIDAGSSGRLMER